MLNIKLKNLVMCILLISSIEISSLKIKQQEKTLEPNNSPTTNQENSASVSSNDQTSAKNSSEENKNIASTSTQAQVTSNSTVEVKDKTPENKDSIASNSNVNKDDKSTNVENKQTTTSPPENKVTPVPENKEAAETTENEVNPIAENKDSTAKTETTLTANTTVENKATVTKPENKSVTNTTANVNKESVLAKVDTPAEPNKSDKEENKSETNNSEASDENNDSSEETDEEEDDESTSYYYKYTLSEKLAKTNVLKVILSDETKFKTVAERTYKSSTVNKDELVSVLNFYGSGIDLEEEDYSLEDFDQLISNVHETQLTEGYLNQFRLFIVRLFFSLQNKICLDEKTSSSFLKVKQIKSEKLDEIPPNKEFDMIVYIQHLLNNDGKEISDYSDFATLTDKLFEEADVDKDRKVNKEEAISILEKFGNKMTINFGGEVETVTGKFEDFDLNGDGAIDYFEFEQMLRSGLDYYVNEVSKNYCLQLLNESKDSLNNNSTNLEEGVKKISSEEKNDETKTEVKIQVDDKGVKSDESNRESENKKEIKVEPKKEIKVETIEEIKLEPKQEVKTQTKEEVKQETKQEVKIESKQEVNVEPKQEVKVEPKQEVEVEPKQEVKIEPKQEVKVEPKQEVKTETKDVVKVETKEEVKVEPKQEVKVETKQEAPIDSNKNLKIVDGVVQDTKINDQANSTSSSSTALKLEDGVVKNTEDLSKGTVKIVESKSFLKHN